MPFLFRSSLHRALPVRVRFHSGGQLPLVTVGEDIRRGISIGLPCFRNYPLPYALPIIHSPTARKKFLAVLMIISDKSRKAIPSIKRKVDRAEEMFYYPRRPFEDMLSKDFIKAR